MKNRPELSDITLYMLTKDDFRGVELEHIHGNASGIVTTRIIK